ncbi:MAG: hypothetical protein QHC89_02535 [Bosea sp. (in: a-proteobacteria)]|nr:hypothetical protein [Bosea sp. (in: a-proteobacteria)]
MEQINPGDLGRIRDACRIASGRLLRLIREPEEGFRTDNPLAGSRACPANLAWDRFWRASLGDLNVFFDATTDDRERMVVALDLVSEQMDVCLGDLHIVWGWQNTPAYQRWLRDRPRAFFSSSLHRISHPEASQARGGR